MGVYTTKEYAAHLASAGKQLHPKLVKTMNRAGFNIRDDWRKRARAANPKHAPRYAGQITLRRTIVTDGWITVTVEPMGRGQGNLGLILERTGGIYSRPQHSDEAALKAEAPALVEWLSRLAADALR